MVTGSPPSETLQASHPRKRRIWPWAAGSIILPLVIIITTLAGARFVARERLAAMVTPAPPLPPLRVVAAIQPPAGVALWAPTSLNAKPVTLAYTAPEPSTCLPGSTCHDVPLANQLAVYDSATGAPSLTRSITPADLSRCALEPVDTSGLVYLICPGQAQEVALATGLTARQFALPAGLDTARATLDDATNTLYLTGEDAAGAETLFAFDQTTGERVASQRLPGVTASTPIVDANQGRIYTLVTGDATQPTLLAFHARTLQPLGDVTLPAGWSAGPRFDNTNTLYLFGKNGAVGSVDLGEAHFSTTQPYPVVTPDPVAPLNGARALGWDAARQTLVALYADHVTAYDMESLQPYAASPVSGAWDAQRPLPVDSVNGTLYAPDASGGVVALSLARPTGAAAPDAATAVVMARAGLGPLLPNTNQTPPFLDAWTFPTTQATVARNFAIHYSDLGWRGPYPGHASAKIAKVGGQPGDYTITFAVDWNQLFVHTHSWTVELLPDGRVRMLSDTGDAIP
jgi:hypothetical protein